MKAAIAMGEGSASDDAPFLFHRDRARLMDSSMSVHRGTMSPRKLLKNDGPIVVQMIQLVRAPNTGNANGDKTLAQGSKILTLASFLSANAIRAKDSMIDIDWCSSNSSTVSALKQISMPILITAMGGHYFIRDNEIHFEIAASTDKDFIVAEGGMYGQTPCPRCTKITGQPCDNVTKNLFDHVAGWAASRFK